LLGERLVIRLKNDCYSIFLSADLEFHDVQKSGYLTSRISNDIMAAKSAASNFQ